MEAPDVISRVPASPRGLHLPWDRVGLVLGPAAMVAWLVLVARHVVTPEAHRLCGVLLLTIIWWLTEPIPIRPPGCARVVLAVILGAVPRRRQADDRAGRIALAPFGNPTLVLLAGRHVHRPGDEPPWTRSSHRACRF